MILLILTLSLLSSPLTAKEIRDEFIVYQIIDGDSLKRDNLSSIFTFSSLSYIDKNEAT